jgi:PAS domain S-box-containing protein
MDPIEDILPAHPGIQPSEIERTPQTEPPGSCCKGEERYRLLFNHTSDLILVPEVLPEGNLGRFVEANEAACRLLGMPREQVLTLTPDDLLAPDDVGRAPEVVADLIQDGRALWQAEIRLPDGHTLPVEISMHLVDLDGRPAAVAVLRDLTERKRNEEALHRLQEQFRQAQKLESVGRLAGGMAHDFNNLLTVINGYSALMARALDPRDPLAEYAVAIRQAGDKATALTRQLLAFSRHQVLQSRPLDLNVVVADTEKMLRRLIGEDIELALALDPAPVWTKADPGQISQVLLNLAINARDAMPQGGTILIQTAHETGAIAVPKHAGATEPRALASGRSATAPQSYVTLIVRDNGCGMSEETRQHAFEPFFTTKPMGVGTGLGLATVYGIVRQSGGTVFLESELGVGTAVRILLPALDRPPQVTKFESVQAADVGGTETILIVEDQAEVRALAQRILQDAGYRVLAAANGDEALRLCQLRGGPIHLMITDVIMPVMNGCELANRLHRFRPELKVLFMSGYMDQVVLHRGGVTAEVAFLQKPFTPESIAAKVREVLGPPPAGPKILVVDDDAEVRRFLSRELTVAGYQVAEAANGHEALDRLREVPIALALIDLVMPEKEGIETIREVSRLHPGLPMVAMSGAFGGHLLEPTLHLGAAATLAKPIETEKLHAALRRLLT